MTSQDWVRQGHRWVGIALAVSILANFVAMSFGKPPAMIVYAPLVPLAVQLFSGLYLFVVTRHTSDEGPDTHRGSGRIGT